MSESRPFPSARGAGMPARRGDTLADVLERVLDKGIVIAGDIRVDLLDIELLTIRIRLLISSADKAEELGMAWWRSDPFYTGEVGGNGERPGIEDDDSALEELVAGTQELARRVARLEHRDQPAEETPADRSGQDEGRREPGVEEQRAGGPGVD